MPIQILFIQGAGEGVHDQWDRKLVQSLERELGPGCHVRYPRMPAEDDPRYPAWKVALLDQFERLAEGAVLAGHSVGGTTLLHVLAEERPELHPGAIVLIAAPFIGDGGWPATDIQARTDFAERLLAGVPVFLYHGSEDPIVPSAHARRYAKVLPDARLRILAGRDHQLDNDLGDVARDIKALGLE